MNSIEKSPEAEQAIWAALAQERRRLADELETLTDAQWSTPSQCGAWTVEQVALHLITPFEISTPRFVFTMLKHRGRIDDVMVELADRVGHRVARPEIAGKLREHAESRWTPPRLGPGIPLCDVVVHGQDIRRPLGLECPVPSGTVELALAAIDDAAIRADYAERIGAAGPAAT